MHTGVFHTARHSVFMIVVSEEEDHAVWEVFDRDSNYLSQNAGRAVTVGEAKAQAAAFISGVQGVAVVLTWVQHEPSRGLMVLHGDPCEVD